ncbi:hypothetical protein RND81_09G087200 [Saponaria officinalis]|uniref:Diacylglycerol O-acyltransferase n=1 Tax=Saponaria officinalis TaxID=3572 RepID=A0AAW1IJV3_SAPOF
MSSTLKIKTRCKEEDAELEPVSPTGQYFNSKKLSICVLGVLEFEIPIQVDVSRTAKLLQDMFLPISSRFSSIMVQDKKGVKQWQRVQVNIQEHIHVPSFPNGLSIEAYDEIFDKYLTKIAMEPMPQNRPLWEFHLLKYPTSKAAGHCIFKLHHALGDGFSLMGALLTCLQRADDPSLPLTFPSLQPSSAAHSTPKAVTSCVPKTLSKIYNTTCDFSWSVLKSSLIPDDKTPIRSDGGAVEFQPVRISTVALSLDLIRQIKAELGATINDVLTGIVFLGTRLYMQANGKHFSNSKSTALVLLNTRNINGYKSLDEMVKPDTRTKWGNQFAFLHVGLPELSDDASLDPLEFISEAQEIIQRNRNSLAVYLTGQSLETIRKCKGPEAAAEYIHSTLKNSSMTVSNMIGPVEKMSLADHPCKGLYFMVVGVPQSLTITILSYMRTLRIAVGVEKDHIDVQKFNTCIEHASQLIYTAAMKGARL